MTKQDKPRRRYSAPHIKRMAAKGRHPDGTPMMPQQMCIECGLVLNAATPDTKHSDATTADVPSPGDFTCCLRCGKLQIFGADMRLRELTPTEWAEHPELIDYQAVARRVCARAKGVHFFDKDSGSA